MEIKGLVHLTRLYYTHFYAHNSVVKLLRTVTTFRKDNNTITVRLGPLLCHTQTGRKMETHLLISHTWTHGPGPWDMDTGRTVQFSAVVPRCCGNPLKPLPGTAAAAADSCFSSFSSFFFCPTQSWHPLPTLTGDKCARLRPNQVYVPVLRCSSAHSFWHQTLLLHPFCFLLLLLLVFLYNLSVCAWAAHRQGRAGQDRGWVTDPTLRPDWLKLQDDVS